MKSDFNDDLLGKNWKIAVPIFLISNLIFAFAISFFVSFHVVAIFLFLICIYSSGKFATYVAGKIANRMKRSP